MGWMVLSTDDEEKIMHYKTEIQHFLMQVKRKIEETNDTDCRRDLKIMQHNVVTLSQFIDQSLV